MDKNKNHDDVYLDITIDENNIIPGATDVVKKLRPTWPIDQLQFKVRKKKKKTSPVT